MQMEKFMLANGRRTSQTERACSKRWERQPHAREKLYCGLFKDTHQLSKHVEIWRAEKHAKTHVLYKLMYFI